MSNKAPAWSFSSITLFETCHRKYQAEKVTKEIKFVENENTLYGKRLHKAAELYIGSNQALEGEFNFLRPYLDTLAEIPGQKYCELRLGIKEVDGQLVACDFFDKGVWFRGAADLVIVGDKTAWIVDYKTGKSTRSDPRQLALMAAGVFLKFPQIQKIKAALLYVVPGEKVEAKYTREEAFSIFSELDPLLVQLDEAYASNVWNPMPNGLCRKYCEVKACPHNGD